MVFYARANPSSIHPHVWGLAVGVPPTAPPLVGHEGESQGWLKGTSIPVREGQNAGGELSLRPVPALPLIVRAFRGGRSLPLMPTAMESGLLRCST